MNKLKPLSLTLVGTILIFSFFKPPLARAGAFDFITNLFNFGKNANTTLGHISDSQKGIISPEVEQQLKDIGRWDDLQSLLDNCADGDQKCRTDVIAYFARFNELANKNSSLRKGVMGSAVNLDISAAGTIGTAGVANNVPPSLISETAQLPTLLKIADTAKDVFSGVKNISNNYSKAVKEEPPKEEAAVSLSAPSQGQGSQVEQPNNITKPQQPSVAPQKTQSKTENKANETSPPAVSQSQTTPQTPPLAVNQQEQQKFVDIDPASLAEQIHWKINEKRREDYLSPLNWDGNLSIIAQQHSQDMAAKKYFEHADPAGCDPACRYKQISYGFSSAGENIARWPIDKSYYSKLTDYNVIRPDNALNIVNGWMNSPGHRGNILNSDYKNEGIGVAIGDDGLLYITEDFSVPTQQTQIAQQPVNNPSAPTFTPSPQQSTQECGSTYISFPKDGETYSLSDSTFPAHDIIVSTKDPAAHYAIMLLGDIIEPFTLRRIIVPIGGEPTVPELVGQCSNNQVSGYRISITEPGKFYHVIFRADGLPGVQITDRQGASGYQWKKLIYSKDGNDAWYDIALAWAKFIQGRGPAPSSDYYISTITVTK